MKPWKLLSLPLAAGLLLASLPSTAQAEHRHRRSENTAALVAGIAAVGVIAAIASQQHCAPPPRYCPPPPPPPPSRHWVPGHYETRHEQVLVPGYWQTVTEPVYHHGKKHRSGHGRGHCEVTVTRQVWVPERYEWRETRVWVPGRYVLARAY